MEIVRESMKISLLPRQVEHYQRIKKIIEEHHCALDLSPLGSGKSFIPLALAIEMQYSRVVVIAPKTAKMVWMDMKKLVGFEGLEVMSYEKLAGVSTRTLSHPYLIRKDEIYEPTKQLRTILQEGTLFVFDEAQKLKNKTLQAKAARALVTTLYGTRMTTSRVLLLSGSLCDEEKHTINLLRLMGYISHSKLGMTNRSTGQFMLLGAGELRNVCENMDPERTRQICEETYFSKRTMEQFIYRLFTEVVKKTIASDMPGAIVGERDIKNGYYFCEDGKELELAIGRLGGASAYSHETDTYDRKKANWAQVIESLMTIEKAKVSIFARLARRRLEENRRNQVVIFLNYLSNIRELARQLGEFEPGVLIGECSDKERADLVSAFQEGRTRLLIANMKVGGASISLHDTRGRSPRYVYGSPNYMAIDMHQATGRVFREGSKTPAHVRWVYGAVGILETHILSALARKQAVLSRVMESDYQCEVFPGAYERLTYTLANE